MFAPVKLTAAEEAARAEQAAVEAAARDAGIPEEMVEAFPVGLLREMVAAGREWAKSPALAEKVRAACEAAFE